MGFTDVTVLVVAMFYIESSILISERGPKIFGGVLVFASFNNEKRIKHDDFIISEKENCIVRDGSD